MSDTQLDVPKILTERVHQSLTQTEVQLAGLRSKHSRLTFTSITFSAATTLVAGITTVTGPLVGEGIAGWRLACAVAALFAFIATIAGGLLQQSKYEERLARGDQCIGRLKALNVAASTGRKSWDEIGAEFEDLARNYPEYIQ